MIGDRNPRSKAPGVSTLLDGNPANNFLAVRSPLILAALWMARAGSPSRVSSPISSATEAWQSYALVDPLKPTIVAVIGTPSLIEPKGVAVQFRYAFVVDSEGLKTIDVTNPEKPCW